MVHQASKSIGGNKANNGTSSSTADNVIRSAAILPGEVDEGKKEKDDSRDAENQNGTQDDEESIPESEEFRMDSVLMESIESGLNETDDNGDHPSKLRNKYQGGKRADEATQTTAQTGQDPALQLPSFQATALDFLTAVEDDGDYLSPLPDDDVEDNMLMKTIARARAETPNKLTTKRDFDKNRSQNLMEGMAVEKRLKRVELMKKRNRIEKRWFYGISKWFHLRNSFSASHGLWASQIRFIESRFGSGIVSYFALYRWNFTLNLLLALIWFAFVILFGILEMFQNDNYGWKAFWYGPNLDAPVEPGAFVQQLFSGQGSLERSFVLYGHYKARFSGYLLDVAYFVVIIVFYVLSFVAIIRRMRSLFVSQPDFTGGISVDEVSPFGTVVFGSWDYCLSQKQTQTNHCFAVSTVLRTLITRVEMSEKQKQLTKKHKLGNLLRRTFGNLLVTIMLAGFAFLVLLSLANEFSGQIGWLSAVTETSAFKWTKRFPDFLSSTTLLISFCNVVFPLLFSAIIRFERYTNPISEARIMLARTYLLKMSSLYIILVGYFYTNKEKTASSSVRWENELGKTFYQLVWADFVFSAIGTLLTGFGTRLIFGKSYYDFGISDNILELTYRQALIWVGTVFSPMIIIVSLFTGYLLFFVKKFVLVSCSMPPKRIYNSYTQSLYFLGFQLLTLGLMIFPVFYSLTRMAPTCGPFGPDPYPAGQGRYLDSAYDFIRLAIASIDLLFFREIINFMGTIGFVLPLVLCLTIYIYYLLAVSVKRLKRVRQLQYELNMERTDKKFLLRYYNVKT